MYITARHKLAPKPLEVAHFHFLCPYCWKTWHRGGSHEGFVKASARRHVYSCYEYHLYKDGYVNLGGNGARFHLETIEDAEEDKTLNRFMEGIRRLVKKRDREIEKAR